MKMFLSGVLAMVLLAGLACGASEDAEPLPILLPAGFQLPDVVKDAVPGLLTSDGAIDCKLLPAPDADYCDAVLVGGVS